jgi:hypothetical protein
MDYERGTRYFREKRPTIGEFEPWRAILETRFRESLEVHAETTSKAVETLASVDPSLATRMDNTIKNILFMLRKDITTLSKSDPETYAKLIYNQDVLVDTTLADFQTVALTLASRGGFRQKEAVTRWFSERKTGTKDFLETMREQQGLLRKVVEPSSDMMRWKIVTTKEKFDILKKKEEFWGLVALCRAVNELRFVQMPLLEHESDNSPAGMRARYNSLLFSCALFVESVLLVRKLNKYFGEMPEFQELAKVTNKSKEARELMNSGLIDLRNTLVFHFDVDEVGRQLAQLELSDPIFVLAMGKSNGQVYYELADLCAVRTFGGPLPQDDADALTALGKRMDAISELIVEFATQAEILIVEVLINEGWHRDDVGS